jgi:hypothetical protein
MPRKRSTVPPARETRRQKRLEAQHGANQPALTIDEARAKFEARQAELGRALDAWMAERGLPSLDPDLRDLIAADEASEQFLEAGDEPFGCALSEINASMRFRLAVRRKLGLAGRRNTATAQLIHALSDHAEGRPGPLDAMIDNKPTGRDNKPTTSDALSRATIAGAVTALERSGAYNRTAAVTVVVEQLTKANYPHTRDTVLDIHKKLAIDRRGDTAEALVLYDDWLARLPADITTWSRERGRDVVYGWFVAFSGTFRGFGPD